jgi:hypothetical protein
VLVADTYNGKIKLITGSPAGGAPRTGEVKTLLSGLQEPGSIAVAPDGTWIVADTCAHRLLRVVAGGGAELIDVRSAPPPARGVLSPAAPPRVEPPASGGRLSSEGWFTALLTLPVGAGLAPGRGDIVLELHAPLGSELSAGSSIRINAEVSRRSDLLRLPEAVLSTVATGGPAQPVRLPVHVEQLPEALVEAELCATIDYVSCDARDRGACVPGRIQVRIPSRLLAEGGAASLSFKLPLPSAGL